MSHITMTKNFAFVLTSFTCPLPLFSSTPSLVSPLSLSPSSPHPFHHTLPPAITHHHPPITPSSSFPPSITHHHPLITPSSSLPPSITLHHPPSPSYHPPITLPSLSHPPTLLPYLSSGNSFQIRKSSLLCLKTCTNMYKQLPPSENGILTCFPYLEFAYITK